MNLNRRQNDLESSNLHGEDMGRDTQIRDAVRNEGGVEPNHQARGSKETNVSDVLTESVSEDSAAENHVVRNLPVRRAKKGLKRLKGRTGSKIVNQKVVKSNANAVVDSLAKVARPNESGQGDGAALVGGEKENLIPPMLLAGLTSTATRSKKNAQKLADLKLEMELISQCGSGGLGDYKTSRTNMARMKLKGQLGVVEYSRITVPDSVHMGDPAGVMWRCSRRETQREGT